MSKKRKLSAAKDFKEIAFSRKFREDLQYWVKTDRKTALRLFDIIDNELNPDRAADLRRKGYAIRD